MPLGNLTSQFFANVYLNELDQFIKHKLRIKHYIRYVDDFVIIHKSKAYLEKCRKEIDEFLIEKLRIGLHPDKTRIFPLKQGTEFLGMRIFQHHRLIKKKNLLNFKRKYALYCEDYENKLIDYDTFYDFLEGWIAYIKNASTYKLRKTILTNFEIRFPGRISTKEINRLNK